MLAVFSLYTSNNKTWLRLIVKPVSQSNRYDTQLIYPARKINAQIVRSDALTDFQARRLQRRLEELEVSPLSSATANETDTRREQIRLISPHHHSYPAEMPRLRKLNKPK
jgi:hypothetical protein